MKYWNIRLLLVEDHRLVRDGLKRMLADITEVGAIEEAADPASALHLLRARACDAMLIDLMFQGCSGVDMIAEARALRPAMAIVALCRHGHDKCAHRALARGASAYLASTANAEELSHALRAAVVGHRPGAKPIQPRAASVAAVPDAFSRREFQVFHLMSEGKSATQIAGALSLSVKTVATYRARIFQKAGFHSNAELMHHAFANGFIV